MSALKTYLAALLAQKNVAVGSNKSKLFDDFASHEEHIRLYNEIKTNQDLLMSKWLLTNRINDVVSQQISIPNGTVGKIYSTKIEIEKWQWNDIVFLEFEGLENTGLSYSTKTEWITGTPTESGDWKIRMKFRLLGEADDSVLNEKVISLIINPDPKSLWKIIESDPNKAYWKSDTATATATLGNRQLVVASKRGRSHANVGSFRDDDFAYTHFEKTGWSLVAVADGAGSAQLARKGAELACQKTIEFFSTQFSKRLIVNMNQSFEKDDTDSAVVLPTDLKNKIIQELYLAVRYVHIEIANFAKNTEANLKDFHSTLIFCLFKKIPAGHVMLSFGVGDCPIALLNKDISEVSLLNWLDVGDYGGGTRFITMPEIFSSDKMSSRFSVKIVKDFSYLMLMTDGIYDPKFVVEANLEKIDNWKTFLLDLNGTNDDNQKVELEADNTEIENQLLKWLDFWSPGNHDDRTLAIVF